MYLGHSKEDIDSAKIISEIMENMCQVISE